jgi:pyruvate dehydrogenase E1 component alpha subunit
VGVEIAPIEEAAMLFEKYDPLRGEMVSVIGLGGKPGTETAPPLPPDDLRRIYALMVRTRLADLKALNLQRQGRMGTYAPSLGHEACQVGTSFPAKPDDWYFPYFRDLGAYLTLGYPLSLYYRYWMGNEAGLRTPDKLNIFPLAIPVASQIPHAVGAGMAARYLKKNIVVFCTFGDGATSEGDFHEGLNFAGVFRTPNVFICYNNQWAISTPRARQTASPTIAEKARAYGFPGIMVDGNDVLAVIAAVQEAVGRARAGQGPALVEAITYRMGHHTTSDDATKYRPAAELQEWERRDPIRRFQAYLGGLGLWDADFESSLQASIAADIERAVLEAESQPAATFDDIFAFTYGAMTPELRAQLEEVRRSAAGGER